MKRCPFVATILLSLTANLFAAPAAPLAPPANAKAAPATLIVLDASSSMRERIKGETKMDIAKRAVRELVAGLPEGASLGLVAYSHRKSGDCKDIELLIAPGRIDKAAFVSAVDGIKPLGMTPLAAALEFAATSLDSTRRPASIILLSDGVETCGKDPCATAARLEASSVDLVVHAVAFDMSAREAKSIACIAKATGGRFLQAKDASSLKDALSIVAAETVAAPAPTPAPAPKQAAPAAKPVPPPAPPPPPPVTLKAAASVLAGADFPVVWTGPDEGGDFITVVARGTPDDEDGNLAYTRQGSPLQITAPVEPGEAELRYISGRTHAVLGRTPVKITGVQVTLTAPEKVTAGAPVSVAWKGPDNPGDYVTVVTRETPDRDYAGYANTRDGSPSVIAAPMQEGPAEVRYVSGQQGRVLARRAIEIVAAEVTLNAPSTVVAGGTIEITWTGPNNRGDYITVVPKVVPDGQYAAFAYTERGSPLPVIAPAQPGEAEIRYASGQDDRVLARRVINVVAAAVTVRVARRVPLGAPVSIEWTGPNNENDYLTIVPAGTPDGVYGSFAWTLNGSPAQIDSPDAPGSYEARYMTGQGDRVLGRAAFVVVEGAVPDEPAPAPTPSPSAPGGEARADEFGDRIREAGQAFASSDFVAAISKLKAAALVMREARLDEIEARLPRPLEGWASPGTTRDPVSKQGGVSARRDYRRGDAVVSVTIHPGTALAMVLQWDLDAGASEYGGKVEQSGGRKFLVKSDGGNPAWLIRTVVNGTVLVDVAGEHCDLADTRAYVEALDFDALAGCVFATPLQAEGALPLQSEDFARSAGEALAAFMADDHASANAHLDAALQLAVSKRSAAVAALLPAALDGWDAPWESGSANENEVSAERGYTRGSSEVTVKIQPDSLELREMRPAVERGEAASWGKRELFKAQKAFVLYDQAGRSGSIRVVVNGTILVQVSGRECELADLRAYANALDLAAIARL